MFLCLKFKKRCLVISLYVLIFAKILSSLNAQINLGDMMYWHISGGVIKSVRKACAQVLGQPLLCLQPCTHYLTFLKKNLYSFI